uniref:Uncharacterized protein n=1 Tax=Anguilla anguilla TaxID=7936 RepID=A0A0E9SMW9_ANGAN
MCSHEGIGLIRAELYIYYKSTWTTIVYPFLQQHKTIKPACPPDSNLLFYFFKCLILG